MTSENALHKDLLIAKELVYDKCGFDFSNPRPEIESIEYGACTFRLNELSIKHRVAKITPTKKGQFVTIWKRSEKGVTEPFDISDDLDFVIITARSGDNFGQFIFPKSVLLNKGIISGNNKVGKCGIRVYPPWDEATNSQAIKTQKWQTEYFLEISIEKPINLAQTTKLFKT